MTCVPPCGPTRAAWRPCPPTMPPHAAQAAVKACAGQFTIFPVYLGAFYCYMGLLEGLQPRQAVQKVQQAFLPT